MTIDKISLEDKITYCKNKFDEQNLSYKKQDLRSYAEVPFWVLKNMVIKLIIECKSKNINYIDKQMLKKNKEFYSNNSITTRKKRKKEHKTKRKCKRRIK